MNMTVKLTTSEIERIVKDHLYDKGFVANGRPTWHWDAGINAANLTIDVTTKDPGDPQR